MSFKFLFFLDFRWAPLRFGWKRKTAACAIIAAPTEEKIEIPPVEKIEKEPSIVDEPVKSSEPNFKLPKKGNSKEGKKQSGSAMMDIGVWNPDAIRDSKSSGVNF